MASDGSTPGGVLLAQALARPGYRPALNELISYCRDLALRYVRWKTSRERLARFGLTAEDIALDSIAELFEQSDEEALVQLREHFPAVNTDEGTAEEAEQRLRWLVSGAVRDRLFEMYQEHDPGLARLIRNLKRAARKAEGARLARVEGRLWISSAARGEDRHGLPLLPAALLEEGLRRRLGGTEANAPQAVEALLAVLEHHTGHRNGYAVSSFAVVLRAAMARLHMPLIEEKMDASGELSEQMQTLVGRRLLEALTETRAACYEGYVETGKVPIAHYEAYFRAIRDVLIAEFIELNDNVPPLRAFLAEHLPGGTLPSATYRQTHRNTFEYLLDLTRRDLMAGLREELGETGEEGAPSQDEGGSAERTE